MLPPHFRFTEAVSCCWTTLAWWARQESNLLLLRVEQAVYRYPTRPGRLVGHRGLAPRLLLHPKQAGRYLPLCPKIARWSTARYPSGFRVYSPTSQSLVRCASDLKIGGTAGSRTQSLWATARGAELLHFGPVVGAAGNAPASGAYQAPVLLLNYAPESWSGRWDSHPRGPPWQGGAWLLGYGRVKFGCLGRTRTCMAGVKVRHPTFR